MTRVSDLIQAASIIAKIIDPNEEMAGVDALTGLNVFNYVLEEWGKMGVYIPNYEKLTITTTLNDYDYVQDHLVEEFLEGQCIDSNNVLLVLKNADLKRFNTFNFPLSTGRPQYIFLQNFDIANPNVTTIFVYPKPDAVYTLNLFVKPRLQTLDYADVIVKIPPFYYMPLMYEVANHLSIIYGTKPGERFAPTYDKLMRELQASCRKDGAVQNSNPFIGMRQFRPRSFYVG